MIDNKDYKTAQFSSFLVDNSEGILLDETKSFYQNLPFEISNILNFKDNGYYPLDLNLYHFRENPVIVQIDNVQYLHLKFGNNIGATEADKKIPISKMGYNCSPNGIGQKIRINQVQNLGSASPDWEDFEIGKTGIFEYQVEKILTNDKKAGLEEDLMYIYIFDIQIPISYTDENGNNSKIDFVIDYTYSLKDINLNN
jgi:hypothetical protein